MRQYTPIKQNERVLFSKSLYFLNLVIPLTGGKKPGACCDRRYH